MNTTLKKIAAVLCSGLVISTMSAFPARADEKNYLPSGQLLKSFYQIMDDSTGYGVDHNGNSFTSAAVCLFNDDEILYNGYFGKIDLENNIPADENSVYEWGSISKTFVWVSVMQLWEQGKLDLDEDVRNYLPEDFFQHLSYDEPITMMNLMNHNAGWCENFKISEVKNESEILPLGEAVQSVEPAQVHRPGEVTSYSNYGAAVAGYIVECVSGTDYCEYVHKNILEPLGMEHTSINPSHSDNKWVQEQRKKLKSYEIGVRTKSKGNSISYINIYPAGAVTGTLDDLVTYTRALMNDDAPLFRDKKTQEIMFSPTDYYGNSDIPVCCHGFWCDEMAVRTYGHDGATHSCQADMKFDPVSKLGLVILTNDVGNNWFLEYAPKLVFGTADTSVYDSVSPADAEFEGYYLPARSSYVGMFKFIPYITAYTSSNIGNISSIGNNAYYSKMKNEKNEDEVMFLGKKIYPDGNIGIQISSMDLVRDKFYIFKLLMLTAYVMTAVISIYIFRIKHKLKKSGRTCNRNVVALAGQTAEIISVLTWLSSFVVYTMNYSVSRTEGIIICALQLLCAVCCAAGIIYSLISIFPAKSRKMAGNIFRIAGYAVCISTIMYFEMYRFWD